MLEKYDYFLFDWDGCLANTLEIWLDAYRTVLHEYGHMVHDQEVAQCFGNYTFLQRFGAYDDQTARTANRSVVALGRQGAKTVDLYDGAREVLELLARRPDKRIALVTSASKDIIQSACAHNGVANLFDTIVDGDDVTHHKPHPEPLEKALALLSGHKQRAVMIGDSIVDMEAARNFGIDSVLMHLPDHAAYYDATHLRSAIPTYEFGGFAELQEALA